MGSALELIITLTIGTVLVVNGVTAKSDDILDGARKAANAADVHQLSMAIELYYLDHNAYPKATNGSELIKILSSENYIKNSPANPSAFVYKTKAHGNDYDLSIK